MIDRCKEISYYTSKIVHDLFMTSGCPFDVMMSGFAVHVIIHQKVSTSVS